MVFILGLSRRRGPGHLNPVSFPMKYLAVYIVLSCQFLIVAKAQEATTRMEFDDEVRLNHIQVIGSHNSYKEAIEPSLFTALSELDSTRFLGLEYDHISLTEQLNLGLRKLELDVFYDPEGGLFSTPYGFRSDHA